MKKKGHLEGFDHIQISAPVESEGTAREFYGKLLGLREIPKPLNLQKRGGVWFEIGDQQLHIGIETVFRPNNKAHPAFKVENLRGLREYLESMGIRVIEDNSLEGADRFYAEDPFGNRLEFIEKRAADLRISP